MDMTQSDEQIQAKVAALVEERRGYVQRGLTERVAAVDAQLQALGAAGAPPVKRAAKRSRAGS